MAGEYYIWEIMASDREPQHQSWSNLRIFIVTTTMQRAIELFLADHPDARLHKVERRNTIGKDLIVDGLMPRG